MISYLKGTVADIAKGSNRVILTLEVNQIGYEIQILPRVTGQLPPSCEVAQIFTHQQVKEDQIVLYGFGSAAERDLFRQLTSVSGVGAQLAIALLDTLGLQDLVQAIVGGNTRILAKTPGVYKNRRTSRPGTQKQTLGMATASRFDNFSRRWSPPSYSRRSRDDPAGDGIHWG